MKELVRNEIIRHLDEAILYHVAKSEWASLVHCVPEKGAFSVVPNELVPSRTIVGPRFSSCKWVATEFF
jgi:hypothetical protein